MQPPYASDSLTREEFLRNLKESKLLSAESLAVFLTGWPATPETEAAGVARSVVATGQLTAYQVEAIRERRFYDLRIGTYEVLDRIGAGGMGTVYKARHRRMKRTVAIKVLQPNLCADISFIKRFQREVETVARLTHPNVVMAYDAGEAEVGHFLVMEYVNGWDLSTSVQKQGQFPIPAAVNTILQAARGLEYAHSQQVIHRDIKPANILRDENGVVKITDLGLARFSITKATGSSLTAAGVILGTADYMSPEQALDCVTIDHRADIYSLGCTLFFLLTGQPLYQADSLMALLLKHREAPIPSLRATRPAVPAALDDIFRKMVGKAPQDRQQTMTEVVQAMEALAATLAPPAAAPAPPAVVPAGVRSPADTTPKAAAPITVLLVEPSRTQAVIIRKYLQDLGIDPLDAVPSGQAALAAMKKELPRVIVSALHLKDMTGLELAEKSQALYGSVAPGFLLISSQAESQQIGALSVTGLITMLHKPFTLEQLRDGIRLMSGEGLRDVATKPTAHEETLVKMPTAPSGRSGSAQGMPRRRDVLKVLLANDSGNGRARMRQVLQGQGFTNFVEVADGPQGVAAVSSDTYALVVVEDNMPTLDVPALVQYLRQNGSAHLPILVVTATTNASALEPLKRQGVAILNDPTFSAGAVKEIIDRFFP